PGGACQCRQGGHRRQCLVWDADGTRPAILPRHSDQADGLWSGAGDSVPDRRARASRVRKGARMTAPRDHLRRPLSPGAPIAYWQLGRTAEARYDVPDQPMQGEMDPFFFLTKHKNFIPHEYPCRTAFGKERRDKRPTPRGDFAATRFWLPFGSPRVDLSGFWFRPTAVGTWARTMVDARAAGPARVRLGTCGGAILFVNGAEIGWMAD